MSIGPALGFQPGRSGFVQRSGPPGNGLMRLPRMSTRRAMIGVALAALVLWPSVTAFRVDHVRTTRLWHVWNDDAGDQWVIFHTLPFWPRYWASLLGTRSFINIRCDCNLSPEGRWRHVKTFMDRKPVDNGYEFDHEDYYKILFSHNSLKYQDSITTGSKARPDGDSSGPEPRR